MFLEHNFETQEALISGRSNLTPKLTPFETDKEIELPVFRQPTQALKSVELTPPRFVGV
jgi:hypothetical protein